MTYYKKSTEIREVIDPAKLPGVTLRLGESLTHEGLILWTQGNNKDAEERFARGRGIWEGASRSNTASAGTSPRFSLGNLKINWSGSLMSTGAGKKRSYSWNSALPVYEEYLRRRAK